MVMSFLTLYLIGSLHFSLPQAGYAVAAFGAGAVGGQFLGGRLTDTIGYQKTQLITLIGNGLGFFSLLFVEKFEMMCLTLFVCNVFGEAFRPANTVAIRMNSTPETLTRSFSLIRLAANLALSIALVFGGALVAYGWHYIFWVDALTCWAAAVALWILIPEIKKTASVSPLGAPLPADIVPLPKNSISPFRDTHFLFFVFLTFLGAMVFLQIVFTVPPFFKNVYHWDEQTIGMIAAINGCMVMLVEMPLIFGIENKRSKLWFVVLGIMLYLVSYAVFLLPIEFKWFAAVFYMVVISFGEIFVMPFSTNWAMSRASEVNQGQYISMYGTAYSAAFIVAPIVGTQVIHRYGYDALWLLSCGLMLFTAAGFVLLKQMNFKRNL
jgi:predicted MFS family arabinose efflux permease